MPADGSVATLAEFTADLGDSFTPAPLPASGSGFNSLDCVGLTCYAVGTAQGTFRGIVARSNDGGASWRRQTRARRGNAPGADRVQHRADLRRRRE